MACCGTHSEDATTDLTTAPGEAGYVANRVLLVEDDPSVREAATIVLERAGFVVHPVSDGARALDAASKQAFDAVLLDLMLPSVSGFDVCRELRKMSGVPIIMLTARDDVTDVVAGLELGADDYITKPFEPAELAARIRAVLRRGPHEATAIADRMNIRDVVVDEAAFRAYRDGEELPLTTIEFKLLAELVRNAGNVLTRNVLLQRVWDYDYLGDSRLVDMAVKRLRDKIGGSGDPYISTVRGIGYRFDRG